jgi:hypothetical protein
VRLNRIVQSRSPASLAKLARSWSLSRQGGAARDRVVALLAASLGELRWAATSLAPVLIVQQPGPGQQANTSASAAVVVASSAEVGCIRLSIAEGRGYQNSLGPFSCPYAPECVEGRFCEVRLQNPG